MIKLDDLIRDERTIIVNRGVMTMCLLFEYNGNWQHWYYNGYNI